MYNTLNYILEIFYNVSRRRSESAWERKGKKLCWVERWNIIT